MASNIKIVGNILNTTQVSRYSEEDLKLILSQRIQEDFGGPNDYIEYYVYDAAENLLNINYGYLKYKLPASTNLKPGTTTLPNTTGNIQTENIGISSTLATPTSSLYPIIEIDPIQDLQDLGYSSGEFKVRYNLFQNKLSNYINSALFIKEISQDRTEIRLASTTLTDSEIESTALSLIDEINTSPYYVNYLLNFKENKQYIAVNVALNKAPEGYEILFKLYEPLPLEVQEKQTLWVVEEKVEPYIFDINLDKLITPPPLPTLRGPNFDIPISDNQGTVSSTYQTYDVLINSVQSLQQNSYHNILNLLATQSIQINVDYTDYNNFIFFGSANQRLVNFRSKLSNIEFYNNFINANSSLATTTPNLLSELNRYSASITDIISKFDGYERYLYFESSSYAWPKQSSTKPFTLYSITSSEAITWYNTNISTAQSYDATNYNNLEYAVPVYLRDDTNNQPFLTFLNMVGHYFDNVWIYLKAVTDINLANNSLTEGISKDLVYERLKSLGLKLYNSQAGEDVNQFLIGANTGSSTWDNNTTVTGSYLNNIPRKDLVSELYKRIYHNLPLLLKQKGTVTGLENLVTTFGLTSSILNVKEYGGGLKTSLIQGYNNDKVRIVQNTVTGNVLSPILSLQTFPTDANEFRENDSHYIDISFSPQNQIDNYISGAIASNNPTWSLDDYIGDPRQQYSTTYTDLDAQRKLYFETGVSGYAPFTASLLDYNGFIRLVEYFDNSLFKMLEDFVPERASLSTGVTINSPVLERNKVVYANPTATTTQSIYEGEVSASTISSTYGTFYNALSSSNNTMGWFDGELSGSIVNVHQYFEDNYNPYLQPTGTIDQNAFQHSDWNVLLNNVSESVQSIVRQKIEYIGEDFRPTSSILVPAELQDSYLSLQSYNRSRYEGTKLTSLKYNTYTSDPYTGSDGFTIQNGDNSYGKTAVIDRYVRKIGIFTQIETSSFLPKRNNVILKYLVDEFGGLTELNQQNNNWGDVQKIFTISSTGSVSLFDNKKYSNQKATDGGKIIFDSGYLYTPILYGTGNDKRLYFDHATGDSPSYKSSANFLSSSYYITGSTSIGYPIISGYVNNIYNNVTEDDIPSSFDTQLQPYASRSYNVPEGGAYSINASLTVAVTVPANATGEIPFVLLTRRNGSVIPTLPDSEYTYSFTAIASSYPSAFGSYLYTNNTSITPNSIAYSGRDLTVGGVFYSAGSTFTKITAPGLTTWYNSYNGGACSLSNPASGSSTLYVPGDYRGNIYTLSNQCLPAGGSTNIKRFTVAGLNAYDIPNITSANLPQTKTNTFTLAFNGRVTGTTFAKDDKLTIAFQTGSKTINNYTASIISYNSQLTIQSLTSNVGNYPYAELSPGYFVNRENSAPLGLIGDNQLLFTQTLSSFYSPNYQFLPYYTSGSKTYSSSLYTSYGDVDYPFQLNPMDVFVMYDLSGSYFESRLLDITTTGSYVLLTLDQNLPSSFIAQIEELNIYKNVKFLFIKKVPDETNIFLKFTKRPGQTSYGFILPENLAPDILKNIDTITKQVKQKLLADQQGTTG